MRKLYSVAIDGPSGAGKSTVARALAGALGFLYVDTGAIYRTVGLYARQNGADPKDEAQVAPLLTGLRVEMRIESDGLQHMYLNGADVTREIRAPEISRFASGVSAHPPVRDFLLAMQRDAARAHDVVMDGRDIGTVVLPDADVKIFLTAAPEERARRRYLELRARGEDILLDTVLRDIVERDRVDTQRAIAPLRPAEDAIPFDTTGKTLDEVVAQIQALTKERLDI